MPIVYEPIPEVNTHVIRPIVQQLIRKFLTVNRLDRIFRDNINIMTSISNRKLRYQALKGINLDTNKIDIHVNSNINPKESRWENSNFKNTPSTGLSRHFMNEDSPVFRDNEAGISMWAQTTPSPIEMNIEMHLKDSNVAYTVLDQLLTRYGQYPMVEKQSVLYTVPIPNRTLLTLLLLYRMRKDSLPDIPFSDYLKFGSMGDISYTKRRVGDDTELILQRNGFDILTEIVIESPNPNPEKINQYVNKQMVSVSIYMQMMRPNSFCLNYPVVIENQMIPERIYPPIPVHDEYPTTNEYVISDRALNLSLPNVLPTSAIPKVIFKSVIFDDWTHPDIQLNPNKTKPVFIGIILLDTDAETGEALDSTTINIQDIRDYQGNVFDPLVYDAFRLQGSESFLDTGLFNISIYANDMRLDPTLLSIDKELNLTMEVTNLKKVYHIVISENMDMNNLSYRYMPYLIKNYKFFNTNILTNLRRLIDLGILEIKDDLVIVRDTLAIAGDNDYVYPDHNTYDHGGMSYTELDEYHQDEEGYIPYMDYTNSYVFKDGYPILIGLGGNDAFNYRYRIGKFTVVTEKE